jgi:hypothetical protein
MAREHETRKFAEFNVVYRTDKWSLMCESNRRIKRGVVVSALMITCPQTGQAIFTGIVTDQISLSKRPDVPMHTRCPACGREHMWWKHGAWLKDASSVGEQTQTAD